MTEGEHISALGISEPFPFRPLTPFVSTFPACGDSFWFEFAPHQKGSPNGAGTAQAVTEGLKQTGICKLLYNPFARGPGKISISPLRPPGNPRNPIETIAPRRGTALHTELVLQFKPSPFTGKVAANAMSRRKGNGSKLPSATRCSHSASLMLSTTLVGIWSSCSAAACNTPYSARFSPFRAGLMFEFAPHQKGSLSGAFKLIILCFPAECGYP